MNRILSLDVLRGFAVLGILKMNLLGFGLPHADEYRSALEGTGPLITWWIDSLFADGRMRALFCMLFGAGLAITAARGADWWARRNLWLIVFGIVHAYLLLWHWEILFYYGIAGLLLYAFRDLRPRAILVIVLAWMLVSAAATGFRFVGAWETLRAGELATARQEQAVELSYEETQAIEDYEELVEQTYPTAEERDEEIAGRRGGYLENLLLSAEYVLPGHYVLVYGPETLAVLVTMLAGLGLFRAGVLTGERDERFYRRLLLFGYGLGLPLQAAVLYLVQADALDPLAGSWALYQMTHEPLRYLVALGHVGIISLLVKRGALRGLAATGKLALTNYLLQSVICAFIFYGFGLGLFARLDRVGLTLVWVLVCGFQVCASAAYLRYFQTGPAEWLWRALVSWRWPGFSPAPAALGAQGD